MYLGNAKKAFINSLKIDGKLDGFNHEQQLINDLILQAETQGIEIDDDCETYGKWNDKKRRSRATSTLFKGFEGTDRKSDKIYWCADTVIFKNDKLANTIFCKDRMCPMCSWRRSIKNSAINMQIMREIDKRLKGKCKHLFLTLTVKNVKGEFLSKTIRAMNKAFDKMFRRKRMMDICIGYIRTLEVTYNDKTREYHPHLHILMTVDKKYGEGREYIKQDEYAQLWKESMQIDYTPMVDIRKVKESKKNNAVLETSKYAVKDSDYLRGFESDEHLKTYYGRNKEVLWTLSKALKHVGMLSYGGIMKEIKKELTLQEDELDVLTESESQSQSVGALEIMVMRFNRASNGYRFAFKKRIDCH